MQQDDKGKIAGKILYDLTAREREIVEEYKKICEESVEKIADFYGVEKNNFKSEER